MLLIVWNTACLEAQQKKANQKNSEVSSLKITCLSTMLADRGIGEWGYAALVEVDGKKILFDTGNRPETVLENAKDMGIDLSEVEDVFISHNHGDHTGGLLTLRKELKRKNSKALKRVHVATGIFSKRANTVNRMLQMKEKLEADGVEVIVHATKHELFPGVWITGPIERIHNEKNWGRNGRIETVNGLVEDTIPEDQSLVINTKKGFVLISGCGHAGIVNTMEHIKANIQEKNVFAAIGGFHLISASDTHLKWTAEKLQEFGLSKIIGAHCTGINSLYDLRRLLNLSRENAVVGSVGDSFDLKNGINPGAIAK